MARPQTDYISWIALFISILALVLAWNASEAIKSTNTETVEKTSQSIIEPDLQQLSIDTQETLDSIQKNIDESVDDEKWQSQIGQSRQNLASKYQDTQGEVQQRWQKLDQQLEQIEASSRQETAQLIQDLQDFLEKIKQDISESQDS